MKRIDPDLLPESPGSYQFLDQNGRVLYVGKAKSLRARVLSYFRTNDLAEHTRAMVEEADRLEWVQVDTEGEALLLEAQLIQNLSPPYNVRLYDDTSYPYIAIDRRGPSPRLMLWRGGRKKGVERFGPYPSAAVARSIVEAVSTVYPMRPCKTSKLTYHTRLGRACLLGDLGRCSAPCVATIDSSIELAGIRRVLSGGTRSLIKELGEKREAAAQQQHFEYAARLRDQIAALGVLAEQQQIVGKRSVDCEVVGVSYDISGAAAQVFSVRGGVVTGTQVLYFDFSERGELDVVASTVALGLLAKHVERGLATSIIVDGELSPLLAAALHDAPFTVSKPHATQLRLLCATAATNAAGALRRNRLRSASDITARRTELVRLQELLKLPKPPLRIEAVDISHLGGEGTVSVISVLEDGLPRTSLYRNYRLKDLGHPDDYASMEEVLTRRFSTEKRNVLPDLLLIDGGKGQLGVAVQVLSQLGLTERVPVRSLAKREEEVYFPGESDPLVLGIGDPGLRILQRARDETHRASKNYQEKVRAKAVFKSPLDGIPGLGAARKKRFLQEVGGMAKAKRKTRSDLNEFTWLPESVRDGIADALALTP